MSASIVHLCGAENLCMREASHIVHLTRLGGSRDFFACPEHVRAIRAMATTPEERSLVSVILEVIGGTQ